MVQWLGTSSMGRLAALHLQDQQRLQADIHPSVPCREPGPGLPSSAQLEQAGLLPGWDESG